MNGSTNITTMINCNDTNAPTALSFITAGISLIFFVIIIPGNLLIVMAIVKDPYHELKKPFIKLVGNLALADLIVGLVVTPVSFVHHMREGLDAEVVVWLLRVLHLAYFISCTASLLSITAIAIDRHIAIAYPLHYKTTYLKRHPVKCYLLIWVVAFCLPFVYLKVGYIKYAFVFGTIAIITTFLFLFSSLYIIRKLAHNHKEKVVRSPKSQDYSSRVEKRLTKVFSLILTAYLICYLPSCLIIYTMNLCTTCSCKTVHWLRDMQFVLVLLNSCINPFLYAWQIKGFRDAFKVLFGKVVHQKSVSGSYKFPGSSDERGSRGNRNYLTSENGGGKTEISVARFERKEASIRRMQERGRRIHNHEFTGDKVTEKTQMHLTRNERRELSVRSNREEESRIHDLKNKNEEGKIDFPFAEKKKHQITTV